MSSRTAVGRKDEHPPPKVFSPPERSFSPPNSSAPTTRADLIFSDRRSQDAPLKRTGVQWLELSNQSTQLAPSPELPSQYPSTYFPPSNHNNFRYRPPPPSSEVLSQNPILPADHLPAHIPSAITNESTRRDNQNTNYQLQVPSTSGSSQPSPQAQIAALSLSHEGSLAFRYLPSIPNSNQYSSASSSKLRSHENYRASLSGPPPGPSTLTNNLTRQPPSPPSPNGLFSTFHSSNVSPVSPVIQPSNQTNHPDIWSNENALGLTDGYRPNGATRVPIAPPEKFVFPPGRSAAHPAKPYKPKIFTGLSKGNDDNSVCVRIIRKIFKKDKGENTPPGRRISEESSYEYIVHHEQTSILKSTYPLNPYNSILLNKLSRLVLFIYFLISTFMLIIILISDRHTGELLSRLKRAGSPSFHDYAIPPSSVLDLGCGQG
jgi:hypothetical protein